jgi:WD40 repeat protein
VQISPLLKSLDTLMVSHSLARLNDVQMTVLAGALVGESYPEMADRSTYTLEYIREVGSKLWQILTQALGESVNKKNIRSVLERYQQSLAAAELERQYFWGEAIDVSIFYDRTQELKTLDKWITKDRCRLIEILAMGGMGKTALAVKLAQQLPTEFDFVVWRSLRNAPPLSDILAETIALLSRQQEIELAVDPATHLTRLIHYLRQHRCLLIFDNVESILQGGSSRQYLVGYEGYGELFQQVAECSHQSCVLLTSREQVAEVANFAGDHLPVRTLPLGGLSIEAGMAILDDKGLPLAIDKGQELVDLYAGNPLALKIISTAILEVFDGQITEFLEQGIAVFNGIRMLLERQFERLSTLEKQVMFWLAINREWVSVGELQADLFPMVSTAQLLEALEYLQGRSLIEVKRGKFTQQPVVMEYAIDKLLRAIRTEICHQTPQLFLSYALMKAQSKDYVRDSQIRVIVQPLLAMLVSDLGGEGSIVRALKQMISQFAAGSLAARSYGAGNCLNLLNQLAADLTGLDLSGLSIRQADLRNQPLPQVNLAQANLATSLFAESIGDIYSVVFSSDNQLIASGGYDGKIAVWHIDTGQNLLSIKAHTAFVMGLAFIDNNTKLVSTSIDKYVKIWDVASGSLVQSWQSSATIYKILVMDDDQTLVCNGENHEILLWNIATATVVNRFTGHSAIVMGVALHPDGKILASSSFDLTIRLWDIATGECLYTLLGHSQVVWSINFNTQGTQLVSSSFDTTIKIWDVSTGYCLHTLSKHSRAAVDAFFSLDGLTLITASQDQTVRVWFADQTSWHCIKVLQGHQNSVWAVALNSSGTMLVSSDHDGVIKFWEVASWQCVKTLRSIPKAIKALAFDLPENLLVSGSEDNQIRLWDLTTAQCINTVPAHAAAIWKVIVNPQDHTVASCGMDGEVKLWRFDKNKNWAANSQLLQKSHTFILAIAFHPFEKLLSIGCGDNNIYLWDYEKQKLLSTFTTADCHMMFIDIAFHPSGKLLASASYDPIIRIWDIATGQCIQSLPDSADNYWSVAFHPHGQLLAGGGEDCMVRLWDTNTWECCQVLIGHTGTIARVAFSPDGAYLASASKDYTVRIWDVSTGECLETLEGHTDMVNFVVYHPDPQRRLLASCSHDETIRLWDTNTWECTKVLRPQRIYEDMNITGATGLTPSQLTTLKTLGAITQ